MDNITTQSDNVSVVRSAFLTGQNITPIHIRYPGKTSSPNSMSPTIASKRAQSHNLNDGPATPVSIKSIKSDGGQSLLKSAAKQIGRHRVGDGTFHPKRKSPVKHSRVVSFPDKVRELYACKGNVTDGCIVVNARVLERL